MGPNRDGRGNRINSMSCAMQTQYRSHVIESMPLQASLAALKEVRVRMTHHNVMFFAILFRPHGPTTIDQVSDGRKDVSVKWYGPMYHCVVSSSRGQGTTTM